MSGELEPIDAMAKIEQMQTIMDGLTRDQKSLTKKCNDLMAQRRLLIQMIQNPDLYTRLDPNYFGNGYPL